MGLVYRQSPGITLQTTKNHPVLMTAQGGLIYTDQLVAQVWGAVEQDPSLAKITKPGIDQDKDLSGLAVLACLVEAGCLERQDEHPRSPPRPGHPAAGLVSVIIVCHNSLDWLKICLPSLEKQDYTRLEIILVDNASADNTAGWIQANFPLFKYHRLDDSSSLAEAINFGIARAAGDFFLLLNPDTRLEPDVVSRLVNTALQDPLCAAVAAKLRFLWAPAFLNGLGNYVGGFSWGTDIALGHLDLGQLDDWQTVPSACFAAALIPAQAWKAVGEIDVGFPMYYEDSEWCYRARKFGFKILAAPGAIVYHAFSGQNAPAISGGIDPQKLKRVAYGRLRFSCILLTNPVLVRFLAAYFFEDIFRMLTSLFSGRLERVSAHLQAWRDFRRTLPEIKKRRDVIRTRTVISDMELLSSLRAVPLALVRHGRPILSRDVIENEYLPLILSGKTRDLPEFRSWTGVSTGQVRSRNWLRRLFKVWQNEGFSAMLHRFGRYLEWRLMQA